MIDEGAINDLVDAFNAAATKYCGYKFMLRADVCAAALAAVAPLIAAAERERVAKWHDEQAAGEDTLATAAAKADDRSGFAYHRHTAATLRVSAAAIRAMGDADE